jgi:hypothetical protein
VEKSSTKMGANFLVKKMHKSGGHPVGEKSSNLVTLFAGKKWRISFSLEKVSSILTSKQWPFTKESDERKLFLMNVFYASTRTPCPKTNFTIFFDVFIFIKRTR